MSPAGRPYLPDEALSPVAREVRALRVSCGLDRPAWAKALGVSLSCIRAWERGARKPREAIIRHVRQTALKISLDNVGNVV